MGEKKASLKDIAKMAGVSTATVSHVLNGTRYVSPEVTRRINEALQATHYSMNNIAKALRVQKTHTIGVLTPDISNPFFASVIKSVEIVLNEHGYNIILSHSSEDPAKEKKQIEMLMAWSLDGMVIIPATAKNDYTNINCPTVFIDRKPENQKFSGVFTDSREIVRHSVQRLIDKGHRAIGYVSVHPRFSTHLDRMNGYLDALNDSGIAVNKDYILLGKPTPDSGYETIHMLLKKENITAVMIANNRMAIGAMRYFMEHHIAIPKQIAIVAFADYEWSTVSNPPISCIAQPMEKIGMSAAEMLLDKIEKKNSLPDQIIEKCELIERGSF